MTALKGKRDAQDFTVKTENQAVKGKQVCYHRDDVVAPLYGCLINNKTKLEGLTVLATGRQQAVNTELMKAIYSEHPRLFGLAVEQAIALKFQQL